jgi:branched-chain amino acid transport system permease protein
MAFWANVWTRKCDAMTTINPPSSASSAENGLSGLLRNPLISGGLALAYVIIVMLLLLSLRRSDLLFPLYSMIVFPAFVLSPVVILRSTMDRRLKVSLILFAVMIIMPLVGIYDSTYLELAIQISIFSGLALGLNIVVGFAGLLDLGYIAFFAVGAYLWAMFTSSAPTIFTQNGWVIPPELQAIGFFLFIPIAIVAASIVGILIGLPVLRLRGDYLAIVTLGFGELIRILARNADSPTNFTNGSQGLLNVGRPAVGEGAVSLVSGVANTFGFTLAGNVQPIAQQILFYFIAVAMLGLILLVAARLRNSVIGRAWNAIREDEVAAIAMGVPLVRMKLLAFALGASFAGAIGVLYGAKQTFVSPDSFSLLNSISILAMVIVGGLGSIRGVLMGAVIVTLLQLQVLKNLSLQLNALRNIDWVVPIIEYPVRNWPSQLEPAKYERLVFGLLLVLMMLFRPKGLLPETRGGTGRRDTPDAPADAPATPKSSATISLPATSGD